MRSLEFLGPGRLQWRDAPAPSLDGAGAAIVRPLAVARCDLDAAVLRGEAPFRGRLLHALRAHLPDAIGQRRLFKNAPFRGPYAFGHEFVAEVVEVGADVRHFSAGQRVFVSFQICCGACAPCARGQTGSCATVPPRSMYGFGALGGMSWGGALADQVRVPFADFMMVPLPSGVSPATVASVPDNVVDAWRTVAPALAEAPGGRVRIVGGAAHSIGLYAVALAKRLGAEEISYVDPDPERRRLAKSLGATALLDGPSGRPRPEHHATVECSASEAGLAYALRSTIPGGLCTSVGIYYQGWIKIPILDMYGVGVRFVHSRAQSVALMHELLPYLDANLALDRVTSHLAPFDEADRAFLDGGIKTVVHRE